MSISLLLASASPRRKQLLEQIAVNVLACIPADIDESTRANEKAADYVQRVALEKAQVVAQQHPEATILAADTCISLDGKIIAKPQHYEDACQIWEQLADCWHQVMTAVCLYANGQYYTAINSSDVYFSRLSPKQMQQYWQTKEP